MKPLPQVTGGSSVPGSQLPQLLMEAGNRRAGPCSWLCRLKGWEYNLLRAWGVPRFTWEAVHRGGRGQGRDSPGVTPPTHLQMDGALAPALLTMGLRGHRWVKGFTLL